MRRPATSFSLRITALCFGLALVALGGSAALACTPQYDPWGALVGCCKADSTPMALNAVCIDAANPCRKNKCTAGSGSVAGTCTNASFTATNGHPSCLRPGDLCKVGECFTQVCTYIDNKSANGFDLYCDDNKECTNDTCNDSAATVLTPPTCGHSNVADTTSCSDNPGGECQVGKCQSGNCLNYPAPNSPAVDCSTASGALCHPKVCVNGVCTANGSDIDCNVVGSGPLAVCRKWQCGWAGSTSSCSQVKVVKGTPCDTNDWDCKNQTCLSTGKCGNQAAGVNTFCDPNRTNSTTILGDCTAGRCDTRKDCEGVAYEDTYNGLACEDGNGCTTGSTCVPDPSGAGGTCKATAAAQCAADTVDCLLCNAGNCNPAAGAPGCGCP